MALSPGVALDHECGVVPTRAGPTHAQRRAGGNGISDSAIAAENGDIYFYSPEQLDGDRGVPGQQNLYDYREGTAPVRHHPRPREHCQRADSHQATATAATGPIVRLQVTPDDTHMAFVTAEPAHLLRQRRPPRDVLLHPATGAIVCVSCRPDGSPPTADVSASQDGLFLTDDGRVFFSTTEALVPRDTNEGIDVYEYVAAARS